METLSTNYSLTGPNFTDAIAFRDRGGYEDGFDFVGNQTLGPTLRDALSADAFTLRVCVQWRRDDGAAAADETIGDAFVFPDGSAFVLWPDHDVWYIFSTGTGGFSARLKHEFREGPQDSGLNDGHHLVVVKQPAGSAR